MNIAPILRIMARFVLDITNTAIISSDYRLAPRILAGDRRMNAAKVSRITPESDR